MIENRVLNYFLAIAREQNMTKAAAQLHISQSALSKQIADLENQLGVKLFVRTNKSTLLTEDGILFRTRAQEMINLMNKVETEFSQNDDTISGDIYFGCGETYIMEHISKIFKELQIQYPDIHFHIYSGDADSVLERLDKGLLDIGLLLGAPVHPTFDYKTLEWYDTFGILMPSDCELAQKEFIELSDLKDYPMIVSIQTQNDFQHIDGLSDMIKDLNIVGSYNLITNVTYMVEQGLGYALCLDKLVNTTGRNITFRPIVPEIKIEANIITKKYSHLSKAAKALLSKINQ